MGIRFRLPVRPARGPVTVLTELSLLPTVLQMGHIVYVFLASHGLAATSAGQRGQWR